MDNVFFSIVSSYRKKSTKLYAFLRWIICPFYKMEQFLPDEETIIDIGCGEGVFTQYIARKSMKRFVIGVDTDELKIMLAKEATLGMTNIDFMKQNALSVNFNNVMGVVMSDFFHHLNSDNQLKLIKLVTKGLKKNGILLIKEINKTDIIRSRLSRIWDFIFYPKDKIYYWDLLALKTIIEKAGFLVTIRKEALHFPGSTNLLICRKK